MCCLFRPAMSFALSFLVPLLSWGLLSQQRRQRRKEARFATLEAGILALIELGGQGRPVPCLGQTTGAKRSAVAHLTHQFSLEPPHDNIYDPLRAWELLQGQKPGYTDVVAAESRSSYRPGAVSLPRGGAGRVLLTDILPSRLQSKLVDGHSLLRGTEQVRLLLEKIGPACAMDSALARRGCLYGSLLSKLLECGVIEICQEVRETAGIFFVKRKDHLLRLIFDARRSNAHFVEPEAISLASGDALADLDFDHAGTVALDAGDVEVCFYQYEIPPWMRCFFGLPAIQRKFLPPGVQGRCAAMSADSEVRFGCRVCPM